MIDDTNNEYTVNAIELNDCHILLPSYSIYIVLNNTIVLQFFASVAYIQCWEGYFGDCNTLSKM